MGMDNSRAIAGHTDRTAPKIIPCPVPGPKKCGVTKAGTAVFDARCWVELLIRILCHIHIHLQQAGGRHLGWQQHLAINSLG